MKSFLLTVAKILLYIIIGVLYALKFAIYAFGYAVGILGLLITGERTGLLRR